MDYQAQADRPFEHEERLKQLLARQSELNSQLDLDKGDQQGADSAPEIGEDLDKGKAVTAAARVPPMWRRWQKRICARPERPFEKCPSSSEPHLPQVQSPVRLSPRTTRISRWRRPPTASSSLNRRVGPRSTNRRTVVSALLQGRPSIDVDRAAAQDSTPFPLKSAVTKNFAQTAILSTLRFRLSVTIGRFMSISRQQSQPGRSVVLRQRSRQPSWGGNRYRLPLDRKQRITCASRRTPLEVQIAGSRRLGSCWRTRRTRKQTGRPR